MRTGRAARLAVLGAALGLVVVSALAATNSVPTTRAGLSQRAIAVDDLKPKPDCNGITVTTLVTGGANGGNANDLVLGTAAADAGPLRGQNGNDCLVGGGGNDSLRGDAGTDICIGGPGTDTFHASCETQIQ
jgi:Ca2+-binding RTX toxin-like protein